MFGDTEPVHAWYAASGHHVEVTIALATASLSSSPAVRYGKRDDDDWIPVPLPQ